MNENVPALERAHTIVTTLITSPWPMGISDLARNLGYSKSTVHGLVHTLVNLGLLEFSKASGHKVQPSHTILDLWKGSLLKGDLARTAPQLIGAFSEKHDLTTITGFYISSRVLIVDAVLGSGINVAANPGQMVPVTAAALGKVLAAHLPPQQSKAIVKYLSAKSPLSPAQYAAEVEQVREQGVAFDREEYLRGVKALASAIPPRDSIMPLAAVWVVGLAPHLPEHRMEELVPEVRQLAKAVGRRLEQTDRGVTVLKIKQSDLFRATLADNCGNIGYIGLAPGGTDYHVVVPVDLQLARGVKAGNRPEDGTPFGGYRNWKYFECPPYRAGERAARERQIITTARLLKSWALSQGIEIVVSD